MSLKLSVPHNWRNDLLDTLDLGAVEEFYGKLESDILGGGRASNSCPGVSRRIVKREIGRIHSKGRSFNYLFNGTCVDNQETSREFIREFAKQLQWLQDISADSVTVSLPFIFEFIKKNFPGFKLSVSANAYVDNEEKARFWEGLGADKITLDAFTLNRDLKRIEKIRKAVKCRLQVIANNGCLSECPFAFCHGLAAAHASQKGHISKGFLIDFYKLVCVGARVKDPARYLMCDWIRPEDVHLYEDLGIDSIKLVTRGLPTGIMNAIVQAYSRRQYQGNLLDLVFSHPKQVNFNKFALLYVLKYFFHPQRVNIFRLLKFKVMARDLRDIVYIDNQKLDGFLHSLQGKECDKISCSDCGWCAKKAREAVRVDLSRAEAALKNIEWIKEEFLSGSLFSYPALSAGGSAKNKGMGDGI